MACRSASTSIDTFRSPRAIAQQVRLAGHIVRNRIEIVHTYSFYGNVFAIPPARLAGVPVVIASIRDRGPYLTPMQTRVQQYVCRLATRVLVNANAVKDWLLDQGVRPRANCRDSKRRRSRSLQRAGRS